MSSTSNLGLIVTTLIDGISDYFSLMTKEGKIVTHLDAVIVGLIPTQTPFIDLDNPTLAGRVERHFELTNSQQDNDGIPETLRAQAEEQIFPFSELSKLSEVAKQVTVQAKLTFTLQSSDKIIQEFEFSIKV